MGPVASFQFGYLYFRVCIVVTVAPQVISIIRGIFLFLTRLEVSTDA